MDYLPQFRDFYSMPESQIREKYGKDSRFTEILAVQGQKILKDIQSSLTFFVSNVTWAIILTVTFMSILFRLLYWRHNYHFAEHFLFQVNGHTRLLLLGSIFILINKIKSISGFFIILPGIIYLYKSMRVFYMQSRKLTFLKMSIALFAYIFIIIFCLLLILLLSALLL